MTVVTEVVHPRGLDFLNQRKVVLLRDKLLPNGKILAFRKIAFKVRNLKGKQPSEDVVRRVYVRFSMKKSRVSYNFSKCGRHP